MTTQLQTTDKPESLSALLKQPVYADRFKEVLRDRAPQFMSSLIQVGRSLGPDCEPKSIIASAMQAAALDLPIDKNLGFAWLVPYKQKGVKYAQFQMGWKGYVQLAQRSGQYKNISTPRPINKEAFKGYDSIGVPIIDWNAVDESKETIGYAFGWRLVNGGESVFYWSNEKIEAHAKRYSQAYRSGFDTPWKTHKPEMSAKTLVKNSLSQFGILSIQMQTAVSVDSAVFKDVDSEPEFMDNEKSEEEKPDLSAPSKPELLVEQPTQPLPEEDNIPFDPPPAKEEPKGPTPQSLLKEMLATLKIEEHLFEHYLAVNPHLGYKVTGTLSTWPDDMCIAIGKDADLMSKAKKKLGK